MSDHQDLNETRDARDLKGAGARGKLQATRVGLADTHPSIEREPPTPAAQTAAPKPAPSQQETQVGLVATRPSIERLETKEEQGAGAVSPVEATMPSQDDLAFRVEDAVEYDRERDSIESMLFGTPVTTHRIGRFAILNRLGQGAMGTVYTAYDEELDRKVAIKVLRYREEDDKGTASARLLREAQAMARLSHPNIVGVHEAGRHEGRVYVAMEFVRGTSLDRWLREGESPRPWQEVVAAFRQAGKGLAAAHAAGVIHRDFKPHNVMFGEDQVVRVLDFGLARQVSRADMEALPYAEFEAQPEPGAELPAKLTATGAVMGTPAYMAPEQCLGQVADARSDQFGFCAALFEGLYGQLPFAGDNFYELFAHVVAGEVREPPKAALARVPAWIHRIVMQGLSTDPAERHASMDALVEVLGRDPAVTRRRWLGAAGIALAAGLGSVGLTMALQGPAELAAPSPCSEVAAGLAEVHDAARMAKTEDALLATGINYAQDTWSRLAPRLDGYASEWVERSESVCLAHHDGRLSSELFDRATACLAERRASLDAMFSVLEQADADVLGRALDAAAGLPALATCADERWLASSVPRPADPELAVAVDAQREQLAAAMTQHRAGRTEQAASRLDAVRERAQEFDDVALLAEVALARGTVALDGFDADLADVMLSEAISSALAIGHTRVASEAVSRRLFVRGVYQQRSDEAAVDQDYGAALVAGLPEASALRWLYYNNAGTTLQTRDELERADEFYARALAQLDADAPSFESMVTRSNRAQLAFARQDVEGALAGQRAAVDDAITFYGAEHPTVATYLYILASLERDAGMIDEAGQTIARALRIREAEGAGPDAVRPPLRLAAEVALRRGDFEQAKQLAERGLIDVTGPDYYVIMLRHALGDAQVALGQLGAGVAAHGQALAEAEQFFADDPSEVARSLVMFSVASIAAGEPERALELAERAVALREAEVDAPPQGLFDALVQRADAERVIGEFARADASLSRAEAMLSADNPMLFEAGDVRLSLAQAMREAGLDGRAVAERARAIYEGLGPEFSAQLDEVTRWLESGGED